MPAKSKAQQRFFGMVDAYKKGEMPDASQEIKDAAKSMTKKQIKDFAETKHKGLPEHKKKAKKITEREIKDAIKKVLLNEIKFRGKEYHGTNPQDWLNIANERFKRALKGGGINGRDVSNRQRDMQLAYLEEEEDDEQELNESFNSMKAGWKLGSKEMNNQADRSAKANMNKELKQNIYKTGANNFGRKISDEFADLIRGIETLFTLVNNPQDKTMLRNFARQLEHFNESIWGGSYKIGDFYNPSEQTIDDIIKESISNFIDKARGAVRGAKYGSDEMQRRSKIDAQNKAHFDTLENSRKANEENIKLVEGATRMLMFHYNKINALEFNNEYGNRIKNSVLNDVKDLYDLLSNKLFELKNALRLHDEYR